MNNFFLKKMYTSGRLITITRIMIIIIRIIIIIFKELCYLQKKTTILINYSNQDILINNTRT
jgi:hypothetical protein